MMLKWFEISCQCEFEVVHIRGVKNIMADGLSRSMEVETFQSMTVEHLTRNKIPPTSEEHKLQLVSEAHEFGHFGEQEVFMKLWQKGSWWSGMRKDIKSELSKCIQCLSFNVLKRGFHPLKSVTAELPWDHKAIDLVTPLPNSEDRMDTLLVICDVMSRFVILRCFSSKKMT